MRFPIKDRQQNHRIAQKLLDRLIFGIEQFAGKMLELREPLDLLHALGDAANVRSRERALVVRTQRINDAEIGALVCSRELPAPNA